MKKTLRLIFVLGLCYFAVSCSKESDTITTDTGIADSEGKTGLYTEHQDEQRALEIFYAFLEKIEDETTRSNGTPRVSGINHTTASFYRGETLSRVAENDMHVFELTVENADNSKGFAVISGYDEPESVLAYAPQGSITDTTYNEGLASFFRELAAFGKEVAVQKAATRAALPPNYNHKQPNDINFYRHVPNTTTTLKTISYAAYAQLPATDKNVKWESAGSASSMSRIIKLWWDQGKPYNNKVPALAQSTGERVNVGCVPVAVAQVMAYHERPAKYDWATLKAGYTIDPNNAAASDKVSTLMTDIATALHTKYDSKNNTGGTTSDYILTELSSFGYKATKTTYDTNYANDFIISCLQNKRPVLVAGSRYTINGLVGHMWVCDGYSTDYFWKYQYTPSGSNYNYTKSKYALNYLYCNWGWGGTSNGWYYTFSPAGTNVSYEYNKRIFDIQPK